MNQMCAAPWMEGVFLPTGDFNICCRNLTSFGDWKKQDLKDIWNGEKLQAFRAQMVRGEYPDQTCRKCYEIGAQRTLYQGLSAQFQVLIESVRGYLGKDPLSILVLLPLMTHPVPGEKADSVLSAFFSEIDSLLLEKKSTPYFSLQDTADTYEKSPGLLSIPYLYEVSLTKLRKIAEIIKSFLSAERAPAVITPFRLVGLITHCNAACIHCPFHYGKGVITGPELNDTERRLAFSYQEDMVDFFLYGTELFLYTEWKQVAELLYKNGIKLSMSTNGILLSPENIRFMIDNRLLKNLNVSLEGARKETIQSIRQGVDFEKLIENLRFLITYASKRQYMFNLSFSFVLMKRNYQEFPMLFRLINKLRNGEKFPFVSVMCQAVGDQGVPDHVAFVSEEHHARIDRNELEKIFRAALSESEAKGIPTHVFGSMDLGDFVADGCQFPPL